MGGAGEGRILKSSLKDREDALCLPLVVSWFSGLLSPAGRLLAGGCCASVTLHLEGQEGWRLDPWHNF